MLGAGLFPLQDVHVAPGNTGSASPDPRAGGAWGDQGRAGSNVPFWLSPISGDDTGPTGQWDTISPMPSIVALAKFV